MDRAARTAWLDSLCRPRGDLTLCRVKAALAAAGDPQRGFHCIIVAGTNGKGSTASLLARMLQAHGLRTGLYTSPSMLRVNERIRFDGAAIDDDALDTLVGELAPLGGRFSLTYFEFLTIAALSWYRARGAECAVLEAGLGGRVDATNATDAATAVLTPVALDHTDLLGANHAAIAREKAGIVRAGAPVVSAGQEVSAAAAIANACASVGAPLRVQGADFWLDRIPATGLAAPELFDYRSRGLRLDGVEVGLRGPHQAGNAAVAIAAFEAFAEARGIRVTGTGIMEALSGAWWPGRFQLLDDDPPLIADGAHNPHGIAALVATLRERAPGRPIHLVFGALRDKDVASMAARFAGTAVDAAVVRPPSSRAADPETVAAVLMHAGITSETHTETARAIDAARRRARNSGGVVLVCGSLYLVARVLQLVGGPQHERRPALRGDGYTARHAPSDVV